MRASFALCAALSVLLCLLVSFAPVEAVEAVEERQNVTIRPWQYCVGCKETVFHYLQRTHEGLKEMGRAQKRPTSVLESGEISQGMCDDKYFDPFEPFVRYSCIKLMTEAPRTFLEQFSGAFSANSILNKADNFQRKRRICVKHFKACPAEEFKKANVSSSKRTRCNACRIVGREIETYQRTVAKNASLAQFLDRDFCSNMGYSYQPYHWVEDVCDEMIEEKLSDIMDILRFNRQVASTGFAPSETATDMMCKEFYKCKAPAKNNNNNNEL